MRGVTGTEWEYEEARTRAEESGAPALLVFRNHSEVRFSATDLALRARQLAQLQALDEFWLVCAFGFHRCADRS